ncbi:hypothetical protein BJ878DRAFT_6341 [Calycina marina]|uniref:Uncharacterized protein n=1 Tax=Calycina marina TaxID=1763456 RepID=A0A9P7YUE9_9HELO|nr:hypothetical protein BJ878DRAFT_6341 [Calycina marina]
MQAAAKLAQEHKDVGLAPERLCENLDHAIIRLCISLLDHILFDTVYDGVVIVFMAVLGIHAPASAGGQDVTFHDSLHYTPYLSAIIKIAQILVIQRAVLAVDQGEVPHLADMLNALRERFMVYV